MFFALGIWYCFYLVRRLWWIQGARYHRKKWSSSSLKIFVPKIIRLLPPKNKTCSSWDVYPFKPTRKKKWKGWACRRPFSWPCQESSAQGKSDPSRPCKDGRRVDMQHGSLLPCFGWSKESIQSKWNHPWLWLWFSASHPLWPKQVEKNPHLFLG